MAQERARAPAGEGLAEQAFGRAIGGDDPLVAVDQHQRHRDRVEAGGDGLRLHARSLAELSAVSCWIAAEK